MMFLSAVSTFKKALDKVNKFAHRLATFLLFLKIYSFSGVGNEKDDMDFTSRSTNSTFTVGPCRFRAARCSGVRP